MKVITNGNKTNKDRRWSRYLVHRASRSHHVHDVSTPAVSSHRESPANDLAKSGEVRYDTKVLLSAPLGYSEASHDLIKTHKRTILMRNVYNALQRKVISSETN